MPDTLDIQKVISTSTSSVSLDDLNKKGFKQVKVLNQAIITKLIGEAVDRVLSERSKEISKEERDKVIKEARTQFETLAKKRLEKERGRIEELEHANNSLTAELETLRKRLSASVEVQAARDQAVAKLETLQAEVNRLQIDLTHRTTELATRSSEVSKLRSSESRVIQSEKDVEVFRARLEGFEAEKQRRETETAALRGALAEQEKRAAILEGQLGAKNEEIERSKTGAADGATVEKLLEAVSDRLGSSPKTDVSQIMLSLDGLSRRLSNMGGSGGGGGGPITEAEAELTKDFALNALFDKEKEGGIESNVNKVKVRENKAAGVKGALAKLKKLQQGVADGE